MRSKIFYTAFLITTSSIFLGYTSYGSDQKQNFSPTSNEETIKEALTKQAERGDTDIDRRTQKRSGGRETEKIGKKINKNIKAAAEPMHSLGMAASTLAYASGDPHARLAAMAFNITIFAVEGLGRGVATIVMGVGRYQERSQEILSITEALIEDYQKSTDKIENLRKKLKELLDVDRSPEPSQSSSRLKQLRKSASNAVKTAEIKMHQLTDILTNEKAARGEKIKVIQADLKMETENSEETIRLLQIKLLQDAVKEIEKKINVIDPEAKTNTISVLEKDIKFYKIAKEELDKEPTKKTIFNRKSEEDKQREKQRTEIQKKNERATNDLVYYMKFQRSPTETLENLKEQKSILIEEIKKLTRLTKMGDALYLQGRGVETADFQLDRSTIVALYREIDDIKSQLNDLKVTSEAGNKLPKVTKQAEAPPPHTLQKAPVLSEQLANQKGNLRKSGSPYAPPVLEKNK